jgi:hypothetical protein
MKWDIGTGDSGALRFIQAKLREAMEVARTTRYKEAVYFTEIGYLAINQLIREDLAVQSRQSGTASSPKSDEGKHAAGQMNGHPALPERLQRAR